MTLEDLAGDCAAVAVEEVLATTFQSLPEDLKDSLRERLQWPVVTAILSFAHLAKRKQIRRKGLISLRPSPN